MLLDKKYTVVQYLLFSKTGFSEWLLQNAEKESIQLVSLQDMYRN